MKPLETLTKPIGVPQPPSAGEPPDVRPTLRVLVLDDNEDDFAYVQILLGRSRTHRYAACWTATGEEAKTALREGTFDVALFDYRLAGPSGLEVLQDLRRERVEVPVILLTGAENPEVDRAALAAGAADYLPKADLDTTRLERAIRYAVSHARMLETVRQKSQLLQGLLENLPMIAGRINPAGLVVEAQGRGLERHGLGPDTLVGRPFAELHPQLGTAVDEALRGGTVNTEISGRSGRGEWHVDLFLFFDREHGRGALFFGSDITPRRVAERELLRISDAEKDRIGGDLHDGLGQYLTGISCLSAALRDRLQAAGRPEAGDAATIAGLVQEAIAQTRALARGLCPVQLETSGLQTALGDLVAQVERVHGFRCTFEAHGATEECGQEAAVHLYRIAQEALSNAAKHAAPGHVHVTLDFARTPQTLVIEDDGCGFDPAAVAAASSGLSLMPYRAAMIGGTLTVTSRPRAGTRVECRFSHSS